MSRMKGDDWTGVEMIKLQALLEVKKLSFSQAGLILGRSRCSVAGFAKRNNISSGVSKRGDRPLGRKRPKFIVVEGEAVERIKRPPAPRIPRERGTGVAFASYVGKGLSKGEERVAKEAPAVPEEKVGGVEIWELEDHHCRFPLKDGTYCGIHKEKRETWCEGHKFICIDQERNKRARSPSSPPRRMIR